MIVDLPDTDTAKVNSALVELRKSGGAVTLGRVLTLVVAVEEADVEPAIVAANDASREHPCRILVLALGYRRTASRLDAQVRVGGDAGAGEVVILRLHGKLADHGESVALPLLLPDAPVVVWWPSATPTKPSQHPLGRLAHRRISDVGETNRPSKALDERRQDYTPGDTDMAWTRITNWRAMLAAALDQPPYERVQSASVTATGTSVSGDLLAGWLAMMLDCPVTRYRGGAAGVSEVRLERASGPIVLIRPDGTNAVLYQPGSADRKLTLVRRSLAECLAEELRRLDPDEVYAEALTRGTLKVVQGGPRKVSPYTPGRGAGTTRARTPAAVTADTVPEPGSEPGASSRREKKSSAAAATVKPTTGKAAVASKAVVAKAEKKTTSAPATKAARQRARQTTAAVPAAGRGRG